MKKNYKTFSKKTALIFSALLLVGSLAANAQMETNNIPLPGGDDNVNDAPIDGFLSIGLIAGAAIGLRKKIIGLKS